MLANAVLQEVMFVKNARAPTVILTDEDCEGNLACFQRSKYAAVPGCDGEGGNRDVFYTLYSYDIIYCMCNCWSRKNS